jgi:hypothetical protein
MPVRERNADNAAQQVMPLLLFGVALMTSNRYFTMIENEAVSLGTATQPLSSMVTAYWSGSSQLQHPPLFEILMQFWLRASGGSFEYLRVPAIFMYLAGLYLLSRLARQMAGVSCGLSVLWLGILWPFGFIHGRLAVSTTLSFFLVSGLTFAYFQFLKDQSFKSWAALLLFASGLVWTNYWGWAIIGCLALDQVIRRRRGEPEVSNTIQVRTAAILLVSFVPLARAFWKGLAASLISHHSPLKMLMSAVFNAIALFVGDAVAPWRWPLSVPAAIGVLVCLSAVVLTLQAPVSRLLIYGGALIVVMAAAGALAPGQLLLIAPWALLPVGIAVRSAKANYAHAALPLGLLLVGGTGWLGVYSQRYYFSPEFLDPWPTVAQDIAGKVRSGATVISNSPAFFLYLTYALQDTISGAPPRLDYILPDQARESRAQSPEEWLAAGHPTVYKTIWIRGPAESSLQKPMDDAAQELDHGCGSRTARLSTRDTGYAWKEKYLPDAGYLEWRIEVREYECLSDKSPIILTIPLR